MNQHYLRFFIITYLSILAFFGISTAQPCDNNGNIVIFANYDGGYLNIDVNEDIPNLKIGIATYEPTQVNISGAFAANVTAVLYAGFNPQTGTGNFHCDNNLAVGSVNPLPNPNATITILNIPPVTLQSTEYDTTSIPGIDLLIGYNGGIIGCHTCNTTEYTGGDNTSDQIIDYFATTLNGNVRFLKTQYGCWCGTLDMTQPPTCCQEISTSGSSLSIIASSPYICDNQTVTLSAFGNFDTYSWSNGFNTATIQVNSPGTYTLQASNGCGSFTGSITLEDCPQEICNNGVDDDGDGLVDILDPDCACTNTPVTLNVVQTGTVCDPEITLEATPTAGNIYQWFLNDIPVNQANQPAYVISSDPANNGNYTVLSIDAAGNCALSDVIPVNFSEPAALTTTTSNVLCAGDANGSITTSINPVGNYIYQWANNQGNPIAGNNAISGLAAGTYTLTVTDAAGCTQNYSFDITAPTELVLSAVILLPACNGDSIGTITLSAEGGVPPYAFYIDSGVASSQSVYQLTPGTYTAGVIDDNGCETTGTGLNIIASDLPSLAISGPVGPVFLGESYSLTATSDQPFSNLSLAWQPADMLDCSTCPVVNITALEDMTFTLTATDLNDCIVTAQYSVTVDRQVNVFVPTIFSPNASGTNDVLKIFTGPGVANISYFRVFDRWGNLISDNLEGWDGRFKGKEAAIGVYAWCAELVYLDGKKEVLSGDVTLVR